MPRELPGFYYDEEKGKYFAIESRTTAPRNAAWNADNVKKQKFRKSEANRKAKLKMLKTATGVKRNQALLRSVHGSCYQNEIGAFTGDRLDFMARVYTTCLTGSEPLDLPMSGAVHGQEPIGTFCISTHEMSHFRGALHWLDQSSSSLAYGVFDVPGDGDSWRFKNTPISNAMEAPFKINTIEYHESKDVIVAIGYTSLIHFPCFSHAFPRDPEYHLFILQSLSDTGHFINKCTIAPAGSRYMCTLATSRGAEVVYANPSWIESRELPHWDHLFEDSGAPINIRDTCAPASNPHLIYSVSRNGICYRHDTRILPMDRTYWKLGDIPYNYIRSIDEHRFLVAGLLNKMAIYDVRWPPHRNTAATLQDRSAFPYLRFPEYRNKDHPHTGLDVDLDSGLVAAAHDAGEVGIYSLRSGEQLDCKPALIPDTVIRCVRFHTLTGRSTADLYVGRTKTSITRYSVNGGKDGDE